MRKSFKPKERNQSSTHFAIETKSTEGRVTTATGEAGAAGASLPADSGVASDAVITKPPPLRAPMSCPKEICLLRQGLKLEDTGVVFTAEAAFRMAWGGAMQNAAAWPHSAKRDTPTETITVITLRRATYTSQLGTTIPTTTTKIPKRFQRYSRGVIECGYTGLYSVFVRIYFDC